MAEINSRIDHISKMIFEIANGNFNYEIERTKNDDELDAIVVGIHMLKEELKASTVSKNYLESIYKGVVDMLFVLDQDFIIQACNDVAIEMLGVAKEEVIGKPFILFTDNFTQQQSNVAKSLDEQNNINNVELYIKTINGSTIPTSSSISLLYDNGNQKSGILIVAKDITERKKAEEELRKAKEFAEAANVSKSRFLANMSHEIRTPLNGVLGLTEIMLGENLNKMHRKYLEIIRTSGKNLTKLINDVLDFSKLESGRITFENIVFNFADVMTANLHPYKFLAEQKGLSLSYHIDETIPKLVIGDTNRINQILSNLVSNAIKFTEQGAIEITLSLIESKEDKVTIQGVVKDSGIGVPKEKANAVFQSFTQADDSVTRKFGGTGLGLSIVKNLLLQMGGDITVLSPTDVVNNLGSAFSFTLHLKQPFQPADNPDTEKLCFKNLLRILIVDDNKVNLMVAKKMLRKFGADVTIVENGFDAINLVKEKSNDYDIILMDIQMPEIDGYNTSIEIRKLNYLKPIVAVTANAYSDHQQRSKDSGMNGHLQKPFNEKQLFEMVTEFVG